MTSLFLIAFALAVVQAWDMRIEAKRKRARQIKEVREVMRQYGWTA